MLVPLLAAVLMWHGAAAARCDRHPEGTATPRQTGNIPFGVRVAALPPPDQPAAPPRPASNYLPGQDYIVSLVAEQQSSVRHFANFMLTVESLEDLETGSFSPSSNTFTKFSERCRNAVVQTSSMPKLEVSAYWRAPPPGSGCVVFRASVVEMLEVWYMDDGPLSLQLCEEQAEDETRPAIVDPCCACEEAKYEMAFEGLWSRHTHPKDFPKDHFKAKFSDVIGASHMVDYRFWNYGEFASEGLKELGEVGSTRTLESELKEKSQHIRTIIKARGIGYPNVTGKTFAVFRVDRKNHLISIVSKIAPSPDWIVGVSGLELCLPNCSWTEKQKIELYPWDIGSDSGISYESDDSPSIPAEPIIKITSNFPNDALSPFYDPSGEDMKPLANLYVTRQRLYEKESCQNTVEPETEDRCLVTQWSPWSPCSVSCGEGRRQRRRFFEDPDRARAARCRDTLISRSTCVAAPCRDKQRSEEGNPLCELSEWSEWSSCSVKCGSGYRTHTRRYQQVQARIWCARQPGAQRLEEAENCDGEEGPCEDEEEGGEGGAEEDGEGGVKEGEGEGEENGEGDEDERGDGEEGSKPDGEQNGEEYGEGGGDGYGGEEDRYENGDYVEGEHEDSWDNHLGKGLDHEDVDISRQNPDEESGRGCPLMTEWTAWSHCSASCGTGTRMRNRYPDTTDENTEMIARLMRSNEDPGGDADMGAEDCDTSTVQEQECDGPLLSCEPPTQEEREICLMDKDIGPCYKMEIRWFFDKETQSCQQFEYGGCRGNRNKFNNKEACEQMCSGVTVEESTTTEGGPFGGLVAGNQITYTRNLGLAVPTYPYVKAARDQTSVTSLTGRVLDCVVSAWSRWSDCSASCGPGYKQRTRIIKVSPINGGKACPRKLLRRKKCRVAICDNQFVNRPLRRRHSDEVNYEEVDGDSLHTNRFSEEEVQEDIQNEIQQLRSSNEIPKDSEERAKEILIQTFDKPPFIRILHSDEVDCELSQWTEWSSCSMTCGTNAYMQRTRSILTQPSEAGLPCDKRIEVKPCMFRPCRP